MEPLGVRQAVRRLVEERAEGVPARGQVDKCTGVARPRHARGVAPVIRLCSAVDATDVARARRSEPHLKVARMGKVCPVAPNGALYRRADDDFRRSDAVGGSTTAPRDPFAVRPDRPTPDVLPRLRHRPVEGVGMAVHERERSDAPP